MFWYRMPCAISSHMNGVYILEWKVDGLRSTYVVVWWYNNAVYNSYSTHINIYRSYRSCISRYMRDTEIVAILRFESLNLIFSLFHLSIPLLFSFVSAECCGSFPK